MSDETVLTGGNATGGDQGGDATGGSDAGGAQGGQTEDLSGLFTEEEITAKRESITAAKAEEERRAGLTEEQRTAEDQAKAAAEKINAPAPEQYEEFTLPEGMDAATIDKEVVDALHPIAKELNLSQAKAQTLFTKLLTEVHPKLQAQQQAAWDRTTKAWGEQAKADQEIGGDKWQENVATAQRALNSFATPELKQALNESGMGNHPELIRLMVRLGNSMREDSIIVPGSRPGGGAKDAAATLYGGTNK